MSVSDNRVSHLLTEFLDQLEIILQRIAQALIDDLGIFPAPLAIEVGSPKLVARHARQILVDQPEAYDSRLQKRLDQLLDMRICIACPSYISVDIKRGCQPRACFIVNDDPRLAR
jgi:hypothetical protein